jgi:ATP-dependent Lon protease
MAKKDKIIQPVLPLRDIVVFPNMIVRLFVGRDKSVNALQKAMSEDKRRKFTISELYYFNQIFGVILLHIPPKFKVI